MAVHLALSLGLSACLGYACHLGLGLSQHQVDDARERLGQVATRLKEHGTAGVAGQGTAHASGSPASWPERASIDRMTQFMSEQAMVNGLALRTLSVSHAQPTIQMRGQVIVEVAASGSYASLKNWQGGLLSRFHSLAVHSMRLQPVGPAGGVVGGVDAQLVWVLYVRD